MWVLDDKLELLDWVNNNMDWEDVKDDVTHERTIEIDKSEEFLYADKEIV